MIATGEGLRLAPFYDLMSTPVYPGLGPDFAFKIGGESAPGKIGPEQLAAFAESLHVAPKYMQKIVILHLTYVFFLNDHSMWGIRSLSCP